MGGQCVRGGRTSIRKGGQSTQSMPPYQHKKEYQLDEGDRAKKGGIEGGSDSKRKEEKEVPSERRSGTPAARGRGEPPLFEKERSICLFGREKANIKVWQEKKHAGSLQQSSRGEPWLGILKWSRGGFFQSAEGHPLYLQKKDSPPIKKGGSWRTGGESAGDGSKKNRS